MSTSTEPGAGAWVRPAHYSTRTCGPHVAAISNEDGRRIRWAAGAIQKELHAQGFLVAGRFDGHIGPLTNKAIVEFQREHGLLADGLAGPKTLRQLVFDPVDDYQRFLGIPDNILFGQLRLESGCDPGAQGVDRTRSTDRGIAQISDEFHPEISDADAYGDIRASIHFTALSMVESKPARDAPTYASAGKWDCCIAHHNSPAKARRLFYDGLMDEQIAKYIGLVRKNAALPV